MSKTKQSHKLTDEQFLEAYGECNGNYSLTSQYIQEKYRIPYSRQAVYDRAQKHPEEILKFDNLFDDHCTKHLITFAEDEGNDVRIRSRLFSQMINNLDKRQRRKMRVEKAIKEKEKENAGTKPEQVWQIGDEIFRFSDTGETQEAWSKRMDNALARELKKYDDDENGNKINQ